MNIIQSIGNVLANGQPDIRTMHCARAVRGDLLKYGVNIWICDANVVTATDYNSSNNNSLRKRKMKKKMKMKMIVSNDNRGDDDDDGNRNKENDDARDNDDDNDVENHNRDVKEIATTAKSTYKKSVKKTKTSTSTVQMISCLKKAEMITELYNVCHNAPYFPTPSSSTSSTTTTTASSEVD